MIRIDNAGGVNVITFETKALTLTGWKDPDLQAIRRVEIATDGNVVIDFGPLVDINRRALMPIIGLIEKVMGVKGKIFAAVTDDLRALLAREELEGFLDLCESRDEAMTLAKRGVVVSIDQAPSTGKEVIQ